jgi:outer membrane protein TolC
MAVTVVLGLLCAESAVAQVAQTQAQAAERGAKESSAASGFGEDEAVLHALKHNPALRAFRKQRAVAEGEIVSASAIENPIAQLQLVHVQTGAQMGFAITLKWTPPQPVVYSAGRSAARAHLEQIQFEIAEKEWEVANQVRMAHSTLLTLVQQRVLYDQMLTLRKRMLELLKTRITHGAATRIELNMLQLSMLYAQRDLDDLLLKQTESQSQLHTLLGILSASPIQVRGPTAVQMEPSAIPDADSLAEQALSARPALKAAQSKIVQREQVLRSERAKRWPWFELSGRYRSTNSTNYPNEGLVGIEFPLPVLNWNSGPIKIAAAELDMEQSLAQAQFQTLKQAVYTAHAELQTRRSIVLRYQKEVLPIIADHEQLMELALKGGQLDLVALLSSEESALRAQKEYQEARLSFRRAWLALEAAVGSPLSEVGK